MATNKDYIQSLLNFSNVYTDAILLLNQDFIVEYANEEARNLFFARKKEVIGAVFWDMLSDYLEVENFRQKYKGSKKKDRTTWEVFHKTTDKWFEINLYALEDLNYGAALRDITSNVNISQKINRKKRQYKDFVKATFDNIYEINSEGNQISMIKEEEIPFSTYISDISNMKEYFHPEDKPYVEEKIHKAILNKKPYNLEHRIIQKNGEYIWVHSRVVPIIDENGKIIKWIGAVNDITLRKEFELKLIRQEKEYLEILDSPFIGFIIIDLKKEEMHISNTWKSMLGLNDLSNKEIFSTPLNVLYWKDENQAQMNPKDILVNGKTRFGGEYKVKTVDKEDIWILAQAKLIYNEEGVPTKAYGAYIDITDRKLAEKELIESERKANELVAELRKADEGKNNFISNISHELRNPIATISGGFALIEQIESGSKVDIETREIIKRQTTQLIRLVDDLLNTTRIMKNKLELRKENIELNQIMKETLQEFKPQFDAGGIELKGEYHPDPIYIYADLVRIKQVVGNLLSNALKFTEKDGLVTLIVSRDEKNKYALIKVVDTGVGISPGALSDLFEPFVRLETSLVRNTSGLGLGLSIVKGIAKLHNGSIEAESEGEGKGTKFIVRLPI